MNYVVEVNGRRINVEILDGEAIVDGVKYRVSMHAVAGTPVRIVGVNDAIATMPKRSIVGRAPSATCRRRWQSRQAPHRSERQCRD